MLRKLNRLKDSGLLFQDGLQFLCESAVVGEDFFNKGGDFGPAAFSHPFSEDDKGLLSSFVAIIHHLQALLYDNPILLAALEMEPSIPVSSRISNLPGPKKIDSIFINPAAQTFLLFFQG